MTFIEEVKRLREEAVANLRDEYNGTESWKKACCKILVADWLTSRLEKMPASPAADSDIAFYLYMSWKTKRNDFLREQMIAGFKGEPVYGQETLACMKRIFEEKTALARDAYLEKDALTIFREMTKF